uniref:Uncharacterized protein n=1 Tax=Ciona savignyi TaxID=51511 RepID=H2YGN9_CIOSA
MKPCDMKQIFAEKKQNGDGRSNFESTCFNQQNFMSSYPQYDAVAPDEELSHDDVFSRSSPAWPSDQGMNAWERQYPVGVGESDDGTVKLLKALKLSSLQQEAMRGSQNARTLGSAHPGSSSKLADHDFEDLKNEMMKKYGFVGLGGANSGSENSLSSLSSSTSSLVTTSVDRATA